MHFPSPLIQFWAPERLIPYNNNPRRHSQAQIKQIARSMKKFGFICPLIVDQNGNLIAGQGRLLAAKLLGLEQVPVIIVDHLTEAEKRAYIIADNKLAENAEWDDPKLRAELAALKAEFELEILGFNTRELDRLVVQLAAELGNTSVDAVPGVAEATVTEPTDLWLLGDHHQVLCGDSTSANICKKVMADQQAVMTFSDLPFNVNYKQKSNTGLRVIANDDLGEDFEHFLNEACVNILAVTQGAVYICMSSSQLHTLYRAFTRAGGHWSTFLIWAKDQFTLGWSDYQRQYEPILYGWKSGGTHHWCGARDQGDVWQVPKPRLNDLHPTMKPVELIERAINNSSQPGDIVFDPFAGSGSTLIACQRTRRRARLIELDPKYVDVIVRRWQEFTGKSAVLAGSDLTFEHVANERLPKAA
jgi:DNA modification methylase